jgi:hypothetical protein
VDALLAAALRYAAAGIAVMPLHTPTPSGCTCRNGAGCGSPGKHPRLRHGLLDASTNARLIRGWWARWPGANIGLVTGTVLDVCDVDTHAALRTVLDILEVVRPAGPVVRSGYGWHLWFVPTGLGSRTGFVPGADWRGRGGSVVAPPSQHRTGHRYTFIQPWAELPAEPLTGQPERGTGQPLPDCPPALRALLIPSTPSLTIPAGDVGDLDRYTRAALDGEIGRILAAPRPLIRHGQRIAAGGRNTALNLAAFRLGQLAAAGGLDAATVWPQLADAATAVGLPAEEVRRTIASGWRAGLRRPRPL